MKQKLLTLILTLFISSIGLGQVVANQIDDFEDATTQGWRHAAVNSDSPVNITTGGPGGVNDNYLSTSNDGDNNNPGARHIFYNVDSRWGGNYTGIVAIRFSIKNAGVLPLHLRVALRGGAGPSWMSTNTAVVVATGGGWSTIEIPILASDFVITQDLGDTKASILSNVAQIRILSNDGSGSEPSLHKGDLRVQLSDYDNIKASTTLLSTKDNKFKSTFSINPNPGSNKLNLKLSQLSDDMTIEVFDVLGKKVYAERLNSTSKSIDVFKWNSGVYLVRITSDNGTQTKRFVKQ